MEAQARIVVGRHGAGVRFVELQSSPPITLRRTGPAEVSLVASAAWPVGGDRVRLSVVIGDGASLDVRSVAASVAHPGPTGAASAFEIDIVVGAAGRLRWLVEPTILVDGCDHLATTRIELDHDASLTWREELQLGRHGEQGGSIRQRTSIDRGGHALLRTELALGPRWGSARSPAIIGRGHRAAGSAVVVGSPAPPPRSTLAASLAWASQPLADDVAAWTVLAARMADVRAVIDSATRPARVSGHPLVK